MTSHPIVINEVFSVENCPEALLKARLSLLSGVKVSDEKFIRSSDCKPALRSIKQLRKIADYNDDPVGMGAMLRGGRPLMMIDYTLDRDSYDPEPHRFMRDPARDHYYTPRLYLMSILAPAMPTLEWYNL